MGFQVITNLTVKEKQKKTEEAIKWLTEQGHMPDLKTISNTLLEARSLLQTLNNGLHQQTQNELDTVKLAARIEELLNTIRI